MYPEGTRCFQLSSQLGCTKRSQRFDGRFALPFFPQTTPKTESATRISLPYDLHSGMQLNPPDPWVNTV